MLSNFLRTLFTGHRTNGDLDAAREQGRQHAREYGGAYLDGLTDELSTMFQERRQLLLGHDDAIDAEYEPSPDYADMTRPQLQRLAAEKRLAYPRTATRDDLIALLENRKAVQG